ncbi:putative DYW domain-containing protein [Medicago truncatula]|uniref:Putative DYW domain-containing protein n=1 Tax=Medicago truncatula TaxID=3880 RepID=A0A396HHT4_MEDTR|nr:putative DYW domain-containing protein [Medicago truncatula]
MTYNVMVKGNVQYKQMDMARELFEAMPCWNVGSWNTMINGYDQKGNIAQVGKLFDMMANRDCTDHYEEVMDMLVKMKRDGESVNRSTLCGALSTCVRKAAFMLGKQLCNIPPISYWRFFSRTFPRANASLKLALAFGIMTIPAGKPMRVMKNLRVCEHYHNVIKYISKIVGRLIVSRDSHRFSHPSHSRTPCVLY